MGESIRNSRLRRLQGRLARITRELTGTEFVRFAPRGWQPAINVFRCTGCIRLCVDLAGVEQSVIHVHARARSVLLRGHRLLPEPQEDSPKPVRVLALEIDHGPFEREVMLEAEVEPSGVKIEQSNGLLWIFLPLRADG